MGARSFARRVLARLGERVARDELFEQAGERPSTPPLDAGVVHPSRVGAATRVVTPRMAWAEREAAGGALPNASPSSASPAGAGGVAGTPPRLAAPAASSGERGEDSSAEGGAAPGAASTASPSSASPAGAGGVAGATAPAPSTSAVPPKAPLRRAPTAPSKTRAAVRAVRPAEGCVPVDRAGLVSALVPSGKPLVVNHWATWCDPCVDELPRLVRAAAGCGDLADFLGVSWDLFDNPGDPTARAAEVAAFADNAGVGYPSVLYTDAPESLFEVCGLDVHLVPQTLVLAPDGSVAWHKKGVLEHDDVFPLVAAVRAAAGRSA